MLKAVLYDLGGTFYTVHHSEALRTAFGKRLIDRLAVYDINLDITPYEMGKLLHQNAEEYKKWSEIALHELPQAQIWNEYYLKQFTVGEEKLSPIAEELSFLYDYERVCNVRRPFVKETVAELSRMGLRQGMISNIISTSTLPHMLKEYGILEYMECEVMSSEAGCRKPSARIFEIAMERMRIKPEATAYVGDTISRDVVGARNAKLALMIQIRNPAIAHRDAAYSENAPKADYLIDELNEIPSIIRSYL